MNPDLTPTWDHSTDENFYSYYATESVSERTHHRFWSLAQAALRVARRRDGELQRPLEVADIGCGAGTSTLMWARWGHHVHGLDINAPLLDLGRERAVQQGLSIDFCLGSATDLPWEDASMDVCFVPELLEHVTEWRACLEEFARILRRGGILLLSTNNKLCPYQKEFNLLLYSWYPAKVKRHFERLASTTRRDLVNYARYPAVNWFSFYSLRLELANLGFRSLDRFDTADPSKKNITARWALALIRAVDGIRWLAHVATPSTLIIGIKDGEGTAPRASKRA